MGHANASPPPAGVRGRSQGRHRTARFGPTSSAPASLLRIVVTYDHAAGCTTKLNPYGAMWKSCATHWNPAAAARGAPPGGHRGAKPGCLQRHFAGPALGRGDGRPVRPRRHPAASPCQV